MSYNDDEKYWIYDPCIMWINKDQKIPCWISKKKECSTWHHTISIKTYEGVRSKNPYIRERNISYYDRYPGMSESHYMDWSDDQIKRWEIEHTYISYLPEKYGILDEVVLQ